MKKKEWTIGKTACLCLFLFWLPFFPVFGQGQKGTESSDTNEVKIAALYPMTGSTGSYGNLIMRGWNIAVDEINSAGGIKSLGGAKLRTILADTEGSPRVGMTQMEKIAQDKSIPVVAGCWASGVTYPVTQVSEQYGLPMIIEIASQYDIMQRGFKYLFRYCLSAPGTSVNTFDFIQYQANKAGVPANRIAIITVDDNYGRDTVHWIKEAIAQKNKDGASFEVVSDLYFPSGTTNVDVDVGKLKASKPDVIIINAMINEEVLIVRTLNAQGVKPSGGIICNGGHSNPEFLDLVGDLAEGYCGGFKWDADLNNPIMKRFDEKIRASTGGLPAEPFAASGYGVVHVIADVLERAGSTDRDKVRQAFVETNITSGPALALACNFVRFNEIGENTGATEYICQVINGEWRNVWPVDLPHEMEARWPFAKVNR